VLPHGAVGLLDVIRVGGMDSRLEGCDALVAELEVAFSGSLDQPEEEDQDYGSNGGGNQAPDQPAGRNPEGPKEPATDEGSDHTDYKITDESKASALHQLPCKPSGDKADQKKPQQVHILFSSYRWNLNISQRGKSDQQILTRHRGGGKQNRPSGIENLVCARSVEHLMTNNYWIADPSRSIGEAV
jgi:hypothetical protein